MRGKAAILGALIGASAINAHADALWTCKNVETSVSTDNLRTFTSVPSDIKMIEVFLRVDQFGWVHGVDARHTLLDGQQRIRSKQFRDIRITTRRGDLSNASWTGVAIENPHIRVVGELVGPIAGEDAGRKAKYMENTIFITPHARIMSQCERTR
jgi:hypothetical protein